MLQRLTECPLQKLTINKRTYAFRLDGDDKSSTTSPLCIPLHGMFIDERCWILPHKPKNVRLLLLTRPGYSSSDDNDATYTYERLAHDILNLVDEIFQDAPAFHILGHSSGGPCALAMKAVLPKDRVLKCILLESDAEYYHSSPNVKQPKMWLEEIRPNAGCCGRCCGGCCFICMSRWICCLLNCCGRQKPAAFLKGEPKSCQEMLAQDSTMDETLRHDWIENAVLIPISDATQYGRRSTGYYYDAWIEAKPWTFKSELDDDKQKDVEIYVGGLGTEITEVHAQHILHTSSPGAKVIEEPEMNHMAFLFPSFMNTLYERLSAIQVSQVD